MTPTFFGIWGELDMENTLRLLKNQKGRFYLTQLKKSDRKKMTKTEASELNYMIVTVYNQGS